MPQNNPVVDSLNYSEGVHVGQVDFDEVCFEDIEDDDLFWFSNSPNSDLNHAFRKTDESTALDTRNEQITESIGNRTVVYQKT